MGRTLFRVMVVLLLILGGGYGPAVATGGNPEQGLQSTADRARQAVEHMLTRSHDRAAVDDVAVLSGLREALSASHLLMKEHLRLRGDALPKSDTQGSERHREAEERYTTAISRVLAGFERAAVPRGIDPAALEELHAALADQVPSRRPAIHGSLPYRQPSFQGRSPLTAPQIVPAYRMAVLPAATATDLAGTPEAPVSAAISSQAKTIAAAVGRTHWDPAAIYNWVRENIRTEWYWGSMKGAEETLRQRSGNDADQAALLIALLRASGYPARYVRGVAEFFPGLDAARSATGIHDPEQILAFFQEAGIPCEAVREGSGIVNLRFEHVWVETLIPYANYRGMEADGSGKSWIPLDTSLKTGGFDDPAAIDLPALPGNPLPGFRDRYLAAVHEQTPLELLRQETGLFLAAEQPGRSYAELLHTRRQRVAPLGILPSTLQFVDVAVTAEYAALPQELQHQVRLRASVGGPAATPLFDLTVPLRELSNQQTIISFEPETVEDQERINRWGGLDNTPAYLVRLRPSVVVAGERRIVATSGLAPGVEFNLSIDFSGPAGSLSVGDVVSCGYPLMLGIVAQEALPPVQETLPAAAPELLHRAALAYVEAWNRGESELADLFDLALARPLPTCVAVGGQLRVDELAGLPHAVTWQGLFVDANLRTVSTVPRNSVNADRVRGFFEISALEGSAQEHRLFEKEFGVESISTAKLIGLAQNAGSPLLTLDAGNASTLLPTLGLDEPVEVDIVDAIALGQIVRIPSSSVLHFAWSGIGYLKDNPATGEAGYMLSGGLAGGQTVLGRRDWPAEIAAIMAQPFTGEPNVDPSRAFSIAEVTPWEIREATAGEPLAGALMVLVRDDRGSVVTDAPVIFKVRSGGGWLVDDLLQPGVPLQELTAVTGRDGIARAHFVPGQLTSANPVVYVREGDRHANLVGENLIDAQLASGSLAKLTTPVAILGFAGLPDPRLSKAYGDNLRGEVFGYSGDALLLLRDRFGNPVANQTVTFAARPVEPAASSACQNPPGLTAEQRDAQLVADESCLQRQPVHGECAAATGVSAVSRSDGGARAGVILGGVPYARYPVAATFTTRTGPANATWAHYSEGFASCRGAAAPENRLILGYRQRLDESGRNVDARLAGQPAEVQVKSWLLAEGATILTNGQTLSCSPFPDKPCDMVAGTGAFTMTAPKQVIIDGKPATRAASMAGSTALPYLYRTDVTLPPGLADVTIEATAVRTMPRIVNSCAACGTPEPEATVAVGPERLAVPIWGVELQVPDAATVLIDSRGIAQHDLTFDFNILPLQYTANCAQVLLFRNGELWDTLPAAISGIHSVVFPAGYTFDLKGTYELQVLLNNAGEANEIRSRKVPLLQRLAAVDLQIDGLPAMVEDQVGAFILLNNDFDEQDADPAVTLPDAATPAIVEADDELKRAWLQIDDSTGQGGSWQVRAGDPSRLRIYHQQDGVWVEFKPTDPPEPVAAFPAVIPLYLEGLAESTVLRGDALTATFFPAGGVMLSDAVPVTTIKLDMAVDGNRDRKILFDESKDESALFWVNNDHDVQDTEDGRPVEDDVETGDDSVDAQISCKRDLEDFSRLHILLGTLGAPGPMTYTLRMVADDDKIQPMVNIFPAINLSDGYLGLPSDQATPEQPDEQIAKTLLAAVGKLPVTLPANSLTLTGENPFLFEGRMPGNGRLMLTANHQGFPVATRNVALELVDPTWFYDHFVVSQADNQTDNSVNATVNPEGMAANASRRGLYQPANDEYVLYVHGWNMQPWEKRRWAETIFKRLWWQGYQGKVGVFDWPCNTFNLVPGPTNYDRSEFKAWQSATALKGVVEQLSKSHSGQIRLLAHSQGNVVAGEALRLGAPGLVHTYVASQAALSASFYNQYDQTTGPAPGYAVALEPQTPDVLAFYPPEGKRPYLENVPGKVGGRMVSYFNVEDYALATATLSWEDNNRYKPDESIGYDYLGPVDRYDYPALAGNGFAYGHTEGSPPDDRFVIERDLIFPAGSHEIFSFGGESRTKAFGAVTPPETVRGPQTDLRTPGSRDLRALFKFDMKHYSHSRQFRSSVAAEQGYWQAFMTDTGLGRTFSW
ncbi:MAG: alpha/beta hydrolase [Desulfuromonadales bacterium]|nr:alpha/beta hydrolase [Desulfuromonadales bacterium]